jgi:3-hydroxybutyryl-CoA dehydrogenase
LSTEHGFERVMVAGAGTMGQGIAQLCVEAGLPTLVYDVSVGMLQKAKAGIEAAWDVRVAKGKLNESEAERFKSMLQYSDRTEDLRGDLLIEAVVESAEIKRRLFATVEAQNGPQTVLASNTSSIPMEQLAEGLARPERVVGLHFFNPAPVMKLVEVIRGPMTKPDVAQRVHALAQTMGKIVVHAQDSPGFIVNRVARPYYAESLRIVGEGGVQPQDLDRLMESVGFRMGPFRLMDLIGVDTNLAVTTSVYEGLGRPPRFEPHPVQINKVAQGHNGRKSGQGFYDYTQSPA